MSRFELYVNKRPSSFAGLEVSLDKSRFVVIGAPLDVTATWRPGYRFGPRAVREASANLESSGYYAEGFIDEVPVHDAGDVIVSPGDVQEALNRVREVVKELLGMGKIPVVLGGEHTVTVGVIKGLRDAGYKPCIVAFDAHFDLRYEYLGVRYGHSSTYRRILEFLGDSSLVYVGVRAYEREEREIADSKYNIKYVTPPSIETMGLANTIAFVRRALSQCEAVYYSIDMDVYDPSYAPGVGNPEPGGLSVRELLYILSHIIDHRFSGIDVVELAPLLDPSGVTASLAAKTLQEALIASLASASRKGRL